MKNKNRLLFASLITVAFASLANTASADVTKANNSDALNVGTSYTSPFAVPTGSDLLIIDATMSGATTPSLGDNVSVLGISASSANTLTVGAVATKTLTIGASGITKSGAGGLTFNNAASLGGNITMSTGSGAISLNGGTTLAANQTWSLGNGRLYLANGLTTGGNTLGISVTSGSVGILDLRSVTLGSDVTIGALDRVYVQSGTVTLDGTNNANSGFLMFGGTANVASMGNLTFASSIGKGSPYVQSGATLNYTGNTLSSDKGISRDNNGTSTIKVATVGQTLAMSGNLTTNTGTATGGWAFGGDGNLTLTGNITDATSTTVTKNDAGTVTLSGTNTYTGATSVTAGTLALVGGSQTSPITVNSGAALGFTLGSPTTSTSTVTFSGATPKVTVSGTPAAATLMTASGIIGIPVLDPAVPGFSLVTTPTELNLVSTAAQGTKADNGLALNDSSSWIGTPPTAGTYMFVDNTLTVNQTAALGDDLSVLGITASSAKNLTINNTATKTLTIGTSGISSSGAGSLTFNNATSLGGNVTMGASAGIIRFGGGLTLTANQTWDMTGRRLELTSALTTGGNTLSITGTTGSRLELKNTTLGTDVTIGSVALVVVDNATTTINGVNNTNTGFDVYNGGTVNIASMGNLGGASSIGTVKANVLGTLNYTGGNFSSDKGFQKQNPGTAALTVTQASTTLSMSGNVTSRLASHTGGFVFGGDGNLNLSGNILNGSATTVTKNGAGVTTLSGTGNTYAGATTVTGGTLALGANNVLPDLSDVSIGAATLDAATFDDTAATLDVTAAATIHLGAGANLVFANSSGKTWAGTLNITGTFVSGSSLNFGVGGLTAGQLLKISATGFSSFALDGSGFLTATAAAGYSSWATTNGVTGQAANLDHDNDGVSNGVEYFLVGPNTVSTGFNALPGVDTVGATRSVTWTKASTYTGAYPADFVVETSETLVGSWTVAALGTVGESGKVNISGNNVTYTFPAGPLKKFARLRVTGP